MRDRVVLLGEDTWTTEAALPDGKRVTHYADGETVTSTVDTLEFGVPTDSIQGPP
jgi:hypothetical protein